MTLGKRLNLFNIQVSWDTGLFKLIEAYSVHGLEMVIHYYSGEYSACSLFKSSRLQKFSKLVEFHLRRWSLTDSLLITLGRETVHVHCSGPPGHEAL